MLSFEPELTRLNAPADLIAIERREIFSVHREVRALAWGGAMLVSSGAAVLVSRNLARIGPVALATAIGIAAAACLVFSFARRQRGASSVVTSYITLLGALLIGVDLAYAESQFHLFDALWRHHFLILTVVYALIAYFFDSRPVLALAIGSLSTWFGATSESFAASFGWRFLLASAAVAAWGAVDLRLRENRSFQTLFEHATANLVMFGGLLLCNGPDRYAGLLVVLVAAAGMTWWGFRRREESFAIYSYVYAVVAIDIVVLEAVDEEVVGTLYLIVSTIAAIVGLFLLHARFRRNA